MGRSFPWLIVVAALSAGGPAAEPDAGLAPRTWRLEAVELRDGRRLEGLVVAGRGGVPGPADDEIEFLEVIRPAGRGMQLISWPPLPAEAVRFVERLPEPAHLDLADKVDAFRTGRRRRDAAATVQLGRRGEDGAWLYEGPDFSLESTADPTLTQEAVVRLELLGAALPSLVQPLMTGKPLTVRLCGSLAEYRRVQDEVGVRIENPAFYLAERRLLVAGSDLPALMTEHRAANGLLDAAAQQQAALEAQLETRLRRLANDLEARGTPAAERADIVRQARQRWSRERSEQAERIEAARRDNDATLARARRRFDAWLAHEAWHAYADRRLRAAAAPGLPAWLDEGVAQVVETAPVEAGEVRLDLFDRDRLGRLQDLLRAGGIPPLADVVTGGQEPFLAGHAGGDQAVAYLTAWGLALDLAVVRPVLSSGKVREFTAAGEADAVARFEALVGMPIDLFDRQWRNRLQGMRGAAGPVTTAPPAAP